MILQVLRAFCRWQWPSAHTMLRLSARRNYLPRQALSHPAK
jgi:hypothetical protein